MIWRRSKPLEIPSISPHGFDISCSTLILYTSLRYMDHYRLNVCRIIKHKHKNIVSLFLRQHAKNNLTVRIATRHRLRSWFPVVDCDSEENTIDATSYISTVLNKQYVIIQSSVGKSWIIIDALMPARKCIEIMSYIPGNDKCYISFCKQNNFIGIRGFPRGGFLPYILEDRMKTWSAPMSSFVVEVQLWFGSETLRQIAAQQL